MTNFKFAQNIENANAARAAQYATEFRAPMSASNGLTPAAAIRRIIDNLPARDGITRAIRIWSKDGEVFLQIEQALSGDERNDIKRSIRCAIAALGGKAVRKFDKFGHSLIRDAWRINGDTYKDAMDAYVNTTKVAANF